MRLALLTLAILAFPAAAHAQEGTPVVGGGSFNTAPLIKPGTYSDTVAAGETVYWKVTLQKGQVLHVRATVDTSEIETDVTASDYEEGLDNLDYHLDIHSPLREPLSDEIDYRDASTDLEGDDEAGAKTGEAVGPRALGYEQILATDYSNYKFPGPGDWYISLSASDSDIFPAEVPAELPIKLEITLEGQPEPSSADFAAKLPAPTATPTSDAPEPVEAQLVSGSAGPGDPTLTIALVACWRCSAASASGRSPRACSSADQQPASVARVNQTESSSRISASVIGRQSASAARLAPISSGVSPVSGKPAPTVAPGTEQPRSSSPNE
jgi:hypothetical protein